MKKKKLLFGIFTLLCLLSVFTAHACQCTHMPSKETLFEESSLVFIGTAKEITLDTSVVPEGVLVTEFSIEKMYKGEKLDVMKIYGSSPDSTCGYRFKEGTSFLVYTSEIDGKFAVGICGNVKIAEYAQEEIAFLEEKSSGGETSFFSRIFSFLFGWTY